MTKKSTQKFKYLDNKEGTEGEIKALFINFKGVTIAVRLQKNINNSQLQKAEIQLSDGQIFGRFVTKAQNFRYKTLRYEFLQLSSHKDTQTCYVPFSSMLSVLMVILLSSACITVLPL